MEGFIKVGRVADFAPGVLRPVDVGGGPVAVVNVEGTLHAISDYCPHEGITLTAGYGLVHGRTIICMLHSSLFDVDTGDVFDGPAETGLTKYTVNVEDGWVYVSSQPLTG